MKKHFKFVSLTLCIALLLLAVGLLASCSPGGGDCTHRDADDNGLCDYCSEEYTDGKDICTHRDADDDNQCDYCYEKFSDGPEDDDHGGPQGPQDPEDPQGPGSGGGSSEADMSLVDPDKFYIGFNFNGIEFVTDPFLDAYTEGMFLGEIEFYLGYEGSDQQWVKAMGSAPISADKERVTNDMNFLATSDQAAELVNYYLDQISEGDVENGVEWAIKFAAGTWPTDDQLDVFIDEVFGIDEFEALVRSTFADGFDIISAEEIGCTDFTYREPVTLIKGIEGNGNWSRFDWMSYLPLSHFFDEQTVVEYYFGEDWYEAVYCFDLAEHLDALEGKGLTVTDDGILVNDAFFDAFDYEVGGIVINDELTLEDGTAQSVSYSMIIRSPGIEYEIEAPETVPAELNFEDGAEAAFDVQVAGVTHTVTVSGHRHGSFYPSKYIDQISQWLKNYGEPKDSSVSTEFVMLTPDSVSFCASGIPVSEFEFVDKLKELGCFVFTYGDRTTTLRSGMDAQMGVGFDQLVTYLSVPNGDSSQHLLTYMLYNNSTYVASETPYAIECVTKYNSDAEEFAVSVSVQLESIISGIGLVDKNCIVTSYYIGDELEIAYGSMINVYRRSAFRGEEYVTVEETLPITKDMISGFDSSAELESGYMYVIYNGSSTNAIEYEIKRDFVTSIEVKLPAMGIDTYIVGMRLNIDGVTLTAYYDSGRDATDIPLTLDMLSELPTTTGSHELTVTYEGKTDTITVKTVKASSASLYGGLGQYYLLGEKPTSAEVRVEYEPNPFDFDYDIIELGIEELESFDTSAAGNKIWSYSWAGVSVSHSYEVVEKAYVGYTPSESGITINGVFLDEAPEYYYELRSFAELNIPAEIDGQPVVAIGYGAFAGLNMINKLTVAEGIVSIGDYAFKGATGLKEVNLPLSATDIGKKIFAECTGLEKLYISGDKRILDYFDGDIGASLTVYVKEGEDTICADFLTLKDELRLSKVVLPSTLTTITLREDTSEFWAMDYLCMYVLEFEVTPGGAFSSDNGVLYGDYGKTLLCYPSSKTDASYTVPEGVERIVYMAYNNYLKTVTLPASLKELGESVFTLDESLTTVTLLGTLTALPKGCFDGCKSLVNFTLPKTLTSIGDTCFAYTKIPTIVVPDSVTYIGYDAFRQCAVQKLAIPKSAMSSFLQLGEQYMTSLTEFAYDGSVGLSDISAIKYDFGKYPQNFSKVYIYGTTSFESGVSGNTARALTIYVDKSVSSITYGWYESTGTKYYIEAASIEGSGNVTVSGYNASFSKWYLG